jgi:hypothetical protein
LSCGDRLTKSAGTRREQFASHALVLRDHQPADSQLILALEEDLQVDIPGTRIVLDNPKYHVLRPEEYKGVAEVVIPMLTATLEVA